MRTLLEVNWEFRSLFLVGTVILGFLSIFMKSQASSPLSIEILVLLEVSTDVRTLSR